MTEKEPYKPTQEEVKTAEGMMDSSKRASSKIREQLLAKYQGLGFDKETLDDFLHSAETFDTEGINFKIGDHEISFWGGSRARNIRTEVQKILEGDESNVGPYGLNVKVGEEWLHSEEAVKIIRKYGPLVLPFQELQSSSDLDSSSVKEVAKKIVIDDLLQ